MSTVVNIIVKTISLADIVREAQEAAREQQLEKERMERLKQEAEKERNAKLKAENKKPDGSTLDTDTFQRQPLEREPGANSGESFNVGHAWIYETEVVESEPITGIPGLGFYTGESAVGYVTANSVSNQKALIGCGNGNNWQQFDLKSGESLYLAPGTMADVALEPGSTLKTWGIGIKEYAHQYLVLPTGGSNFILTVINAYIFNTRTTTGRVYRSSESVLAISALYGTENYGGTSTTAEGEVTYASFVVNNKSIREIDTPQALKNILKIVSFTIEDRINTVSVWAPSVFETILTKEIKPGTGNGLFMFEELSFDNRLKVYNSFSDRTTAQGHSPKVFYNLNQASPYTDEAENSPPARHKAILADGRTGIYKRFREDNEGDGQTVYNPTDSFKYLQWYKANETPSLEVWEEDYTGRKPSSYPRSYLRLSGTRQTNPFGYDLTSPARVPYENIIVVTDWGRPGYCRKMCKALGFADADLRPTPPVP